MSAARYVVDPRDERDVLDTTTGEGALFVSPGTARRTIELLEAGALRAQWSWHP